MLAVWVLLVGTGLAAWAETVSVAVDITNTADPTLLGAPIYEIDTVVFLRNTIPIAAPVIFPSVSIAPGETKAFGPFSLPQEANGLRVMGLRGSLGPYRTKFTADFPWLRPCVPLAHPQERLRVHLKVVPPVVPIPVPPPPPELAAARSLDDGDILLSTAIGEATSRYSHILAGTRINAANAAAWWGPGGKMLVVAPVAEAILEPGAVIGLLGIRNLAGLPTGFYAMRLAAVPLRGEPLEDIDITLEQIPGGVIARLPARLKYPLEPPRNRAPGAVAHIYTWQEPAEPGGKLKVAICIGYHKKNCDCIGIYIEF